MRLRVDPLHESRFSRRTLFRIFGESSSLFLRTELTQLATQPQQKHTHLDPEKNMSNVDNI